MGQSRYVTGKIQDSSGRIVDFSESDPAHSDSLKTAIEKKTTAIVSSAGEIIGEVSVYVDGNQIRAQLNALFVRSLVDFLMISLVLTAVMLYAVRRQLVRPLHRLAEDIRNADEDGIPKQPIKYQGYREIGVLTNTLNHMIVLTRNARDSLSHERARLEYVIEGTRVGTWEWNVQTGEVKFNEEWAHIVGYTLEELRPISIRTWEKLAHPDDLKVSAELLQKHFSGEIPYYECEVRMLHKLGHWVWVLDRGRVATWTQDGKPLVMAGTHLDISERKHQESELRALATIDTLTGLWNRRYFFSRLYEEVGRLNRNQNYHASLAMIDLDHFKQVNDTYGHAAGDAVLQHFARLVQADVRQTDVAARVGGEEFAMLLPDATLTQAIAKLERLRELVDASVVHFDGAEIRYTISAGIIEMNSEDVHPDQPLSRADKALYLAKQQGRNRVTA